MPDVTADLVAAMRTKHRSVMLPMVDGRLVYPTAPGSVDTAVCAYCRVPYPCPDMAALAAVLRERDAAVEVVYDLTWQFAYRPKASNGKEYLSHAGLSGLEAAWMLLGLPDRKVRTSRYDTWVRRKWPQFYATLPAPLEG